MAKIRNRNGKIIGVTLVVLLVTGIAGFHNRFCTPAVALCATQFNQIESTAKQIAPRYFEYSTDSLQKAHAQGTVILYFWAPWCSTCSSLDEDILKNPDLIPRSTTILRVNYDTATELKRKYAVTLQHTFVKLDKDENAVTTWVGGDSQSLSNHLQ